jgi:hypothetical protein
MSACRDCGAPCTGLRCQRCHLRRARPRRLEPVAVPYAPHAPIWRAGCLLCPWETYGPLSTLPARRACPWCGGRSVVREPVLEQAA